MRATASAASTCRPMAAARGERPISETISAVSRPFMAIPDAGRACGRADRVGARDEPARMHADVRADLQSGRLSQQRDAADHGCGDRIAMERTMKATMLAGAAVVATAVVAYAADEASIPLKPGPGRDQVVGYCSTCHSLDYIQSN